ncbi:MAG: hypothetical protein K0R76_148 [Alphaproteobacteria bacterium]|jgi:hypothetical protein|nr:hypothetical protein [Alphaproteobacteria bacterium]
MVYFLELYQQLTSSGEEPLPPKEKARTSHTKASSDDPRRKKKDALEGKDQKKHTSSERDDKKGQEGGKEGKGEGGGGGHQSSQSLQSGQTTVQFSSGGGLASLGSLMALFGSSAALARAAAGNALNANQANTLGGRSSFQEPGARQESLANQDSRNLKETSTVTGTVSEGVGAKSTFEITKITLAHDTSNTQGMFASLLKNVGTTASTADATTAPSPVTLFNANLGGFTYIQTFNSSSFFFSPQIRFAFPNSQLTGTVGNQVLSPYGGEVSTILKAAGISTASTYTYEIASPLSVSNILNPSSTGITVTPGGTALSVNVNTAPAFAVTAATKGLTISASGDLYVNVDHPLSVIVNVRTSPTSPIVPIRLNVGPGNEVTDVINGIGSTAGIMMGSTTGSSVLRDVSSTGYTIIGNGTNLFISNSGVVKTLNPDGTLSSQFALPASGVYAFPENTLYRHIGTSEATVPSAATYGNFMGQNTINLPEAPLSYTLQMGGNVLDVYGTKYGVGDQLTVVLPATGTANIITLGGNTLAGFGTSYGDLQTLIISAQSGTSAATSGVTELVFRGNVLAVDKGIGSILYPHLQTLDLENASSSSPANVQIRFEDSIIQGNQGNDTFYGDIHHLSDTSHPQSYNGFLTGVSVTTVGGQVKTTTAAGNNSITWGNNIYNGGGQNSDTPNIKASDTYTFTLLEDTATKNAVMQGNALLAAFNPETDKLTFEISPSLFKALDGAATQNHIKQITIDDLKLGTTFTSFSISTASPASTYLSSANPLYVIDPDFAKYLLQAYPNKTLSGTILTFDTNNTGGGGSIIFANDALSNSAQSIDFDSFDDLQDFALSNGMVTAITVNFPDVPVAALPASQITASTPAQTAPFLYGGDRSAYLAGGIIPPGIISPYYNELDHFFANSLLSAYSVTLAAGANPWIGATVSATQVETMGGTIKQNGANTTLTFAGASSGSVTIDPFGTISVNNTIPFFAPLTITATDQQGHSATTTQLFGFFDAPITVPSQSLTTAVGLSGKSSIISGGQNMEIVGQFVTGPNYAKTTLVSGGTSLINSSATFNSSLIADTAGNATAYGDFKAVNFIVQGVNDLTASSSSTAVQMPTSFTDNNHTFNTNAIYVTDGTSYGVTKDFNITVTGGNNAAVHFNPQFTSVNLDGSANYIGNQVTFQPQTLYGTGILYGMMDQFHIDITGGTAPTVSVGALTNGKTISGTINLSATVEDNDFFFSPASAGFPTSITVLGDTAGQVTTVYGTLRNLFIETTTPDFKVTIPALNINTTATFANNHFVFGNEVLKGGLGSTIFYGDLYKFGDSFNSNVPYYNGLVNGVTVSTTVINATTQEEVLTITDSNGNSITWGNTTYTGGEGHNTYHFTLVEDKQGYAVMQGFDTITNFDPNTDTLVFNVQANLYARLGLTPTAPLSDLLTKLISAPPAPPSFPPNLAPNITLGIDPSGTSIDFQGGGQIMLMDAHITSLQDLISRFPSSIQIKQHGTAYTPPTVNLNVPFDPVFITSQPDAFGDFITSPVPLTYSSTGSQLPSGISLNPDGTLSVQVTGPVYGFVNVHAYDGVTTISLPSKLVMAINASDGLIHQDTGPLVMGNASDTQAFSTNTVGNTIIGGGLDVGYLASSAPSQNITYASKLIYDVSYTPGFASHTVYGDVQNVSFFNDGTLGGAGTSGQTLTFSKNIINTTGTIYGNIATLTMTGTSTGTGPGAGVNQVTGNILTFGGDVLMGGVGPNDFYGDVDIFGNSNAPGSYGTMGFYSGVTVMSSPSPTTQETVLSIKSGNNNVITWGNDTYIGGTGANTYHFTIVPDMFGKSTMQGFDAIENFGVSDHLNFKLVYSLYNQLAGGLPLDPAAFLASLSITQTATTAELGFPGGGSIILKGWGTNAYPVLQDLTNALRDSVTVSLADPITAITSPVSPILVFGNTTNLDTFNTVFNTNHVLGTVLSGGNLIGNLNLNQNGTVSFGSNTGIINTTLNTVIARDAYTTNVLSNTSAANPVRILGLNGLLIDNPGDQQGAGVSGDIYGLRSFVFIGHGNATITGGTPHLNFTSTSNPTAGIGVLSYQTKLIYDGSGLPDTVYGNGQTITMTNDGTFNGILNTSSRIINMAGNFIEASGNLYGNFDALKMTLTGGAAAPSGNVFRFGNTTIYGGAGPDSFFGHLQEFGNSNNPTSYGSGGFYNGVTVSGNTIQDANGNQITWGNNTYKGGGGADTYNFTIVGTNDSTPQAVMQGFDTIQDFEASDRLNFKLAYPLYNQLAGGSVLTSAGFLARLGITQLPSLAVLIFPGGGSIVLEGFGTDAYPNFQDLRNTLEASITVSIADPLTAVATNLQPTVNIIIPGVAGTYTTLAQYFNYDGPTNLSFSLDGTGITQDSTGTINYGTNTGIIDAMVNSVTANDPYTSATANLTTPIHVIALDAPITDQATGTIAGSTAAGIFIGHGNEIIGGGADLSFVATDNQNIQFGNASYGDKVIYNNAPTGTGTVTGDVVNLTLSAQGTTSVAAGFIEALGNTVTFSETWVFSNAASSTYGDTQNISLNATGGVNVHGASLLIFGTEIFDIERVVGNTVSTGGNTIFSSGDAFGVAQHISLAATNGFYASEISGKTQTVTIDNNVIGSAARNTLTGNSGGPGNLDLYGNVQTLSLTINSPASSNGNLIQSSDFITALSTTPGLSVYEGNSTIHSNVFRYGINTLVGGDVDTSLYTGIATIIIENNDQALNNVSQPVTSSITFNSIVFGDSVSTATGGITAFYGDVNDLTRTNFDKYDVNVIARPDGRVQLSDLPGAGNDANVYGNTILLGNGVMNASSSGSNIFGINLFSSTGGRIVAEGNTVINNFGAPGASNLLNLQLSKALYEDISNANGGATIITPSMVDAYLAANHGTVSIVNGNTVIDFNAGGSTYGSITLTGVQATSLSAFGSDLAITANGTMRIESYDNTPTYDVTLQGDSIDDLAQHIDIAHVSASGSPSIIDMGGSLVLHMSSALFTNLGLSDSNSSAQNFQLLQDSAATATGGIAVSTTTTGGVTNTILTFASTVSNQVNTYGSLTLHDTAFTINDPLSAHLIITHH